MIKNASWALSNFCRGRPAPYLDSIKRAVPTLARVLIEYQTEDIIGDICWAFSYISDNGKRAIPLIIESGVVPRIV